MTNTDNPALKGTRGGKRPGAGRPKSGRTENLPRIKPEARNLLDAIQRRKGCTLAESIELAAEVAFVAMCGEK